MRVQFEYFKIKSLKKSLNKKKNVAHVRGTFFIKTRCLHHTQLLWSMKAG